MFLDHQIKCNFMQQELQEISSILKGAYYFLWQRDIAINFWDKFVSAYTHSLLKHHFTKTSHWKFWSNLRMRVKHYVLECPALSHQHQRINLTVHHKGGLLKEKLREQCLEMSHSQAFCSSVMNPMFSVLRFCGTRCTSDTRIQHWKPDTTEHGLDSRIWVRCWRWWASGSCHCFFAQGTQGTWLWNSVWRLIEKVVWCLMHKLEVHLERSLAYLYWSDLVEFFWVFQLKTFFTKFSGLFY